MSFNSGSYVIAEAGSNHGGSLSQALKLVDVAADAGANCVKFQFIFPASLYLPVSLKGRRSEASAVFTQRRREQLSEKDWLEVWSHARAREIDISASVFCSRGIKLLADLGAPFVKLSSSDLTNLDLILEAGAFFDRVVLSTGMASLSEVADSVSSFTLEFPTSELSLMHCVSLYPCSFDQANVGRVGVLRDVFVRHIIGYSDHTLGDHSAVLAMAKGARFFEKHFTLNQSLPGFDHAHALEPDGLRNYVGLIVDTNRMLNEDALRANPREAETKLRARRGVYSSKDLTRGHVIRAEDLLHVRPSSAASVLPSDLIGKEVREPLARFSALGLDGVGEVETMASKAEAHWTAEMTGKGMYPPSEGGTL